MSARNAAERGALLGDRGQPSGTILILVTIRVDDRLYASILRL